MLEFSGLGLISKVPLVIIASYSSNMEAIQKGSSRADIYGLLVLENVSE